MKGVVWTVMVMSRGCSVCSGLSACQNPCRQTMYKKEKM